jgi:DeoR/GlpR family transcriptional regulator of sugar metabolism
MDADTRREAILARLAESGYATVDSLAQQLAVSNMTVRRDLDRLANEKLVNRTHGGATLDDGRGGERSVDERLGESHAEKRAIGRAAAEMVEDGDTVIIDAGTTALEVARHLMGRSDITVISNSLRVIEALSQSEGIRTIATGGELKQRELAFVGPVAEGMLAQRRATLAFISASGCTPEDGPTDYEDAEVAVKRVMVAHARRCFLLLDASKFGRTAPLVIAPLDEFDGVISDAEISAEMAEFLQRSGLELVRATPLQPIRKAV